ncbi:hypothetical protein P691DRAFT_735594 [Macrolepiota fuliginosa MF-IS2]|uniref:Uncharacterized protein n=1 Tax=Macrolepiota fuliginosa MF-IS2 TaxID=1400762 RepID=A0A9P5X580_9AGAR|nr:hypothetical protein P691DRAFT_735594 [Macrolepiota fuliginosa MF-IS2]
MSGKDPSGVGQPLLYNGAAAPPPYGSSNHHHHHHEHHAGVAYIPHVHPVVVQPSSTVVVVRDRPRCRFCKAVIIAIIVWFLLGAFVKSLIVLAGWGYGYRHGKPHWSVGPGSASPDYSIPQGIDLSSCETPLSDGGPGSATFSIPSSSDTILLLSSGPLLHGTVRVTSTSEKTDSVKFSVDLSSRNDWAEDTIVCSVKRRDGELGVGIFNPRYERRRYDRIVRYDVVVTFPEDHPIVKRFESDVTNSAYEIDDLQGKILFEALSLHGSNGRVHSKSFFAQWADISTSNGRIDGYYNASDFLRLHTSNGAIDVDVDFNQETSKKAILSLVTSNAALRAKLHLHDNILKKSTVTNFDVTGATSNSPLNIAFDDAPLNSILAFRASTSNSPAEVTLHPTFEGHFSLQSSLFSPVVHRSPSVEDPAGKGRRRYIRFGNVRNYVSGDVSWGSEDAEGRGEADIRSSNARVTLNL